MLKYDKPILKVSHYLIPPVIVPLSVEEYTTPEIARRPNDGRFKCTEKESLGVLGVLVPCQFVKLRQ
jgi:hypothetical protein